MRKHKLIFSLACLLAPILSYASSWSPITYKDDTMIEIDTTSIKKLANSKIEFVDRYLKLSVLVDEAETASPKPEIISITITSNIADCKNKAIALISAVKQDIKQKTNKKHTAPSINFEEVPENSILGTELDFVCKYKK